MTTDSSALDQFEKLFALKKAGVLTDAEFETEKARILNAGRPESRDGADNDRHQHTNSSAQSVSAARFSLAKPYTLYRACKPFRA